MESIEKIIEESNCGRVVIKKDGNIKQKFVRFPKYALFIKNFLKKN